MKTVDLCTARPSIISVHQVVEGRITKSRYPLKQVGRPTDGFIYITNGKMRYRFTDGSVLDAVAGDILLLACGSKYSMELLEGEYTFIFVNFSCVHAEGERLNNAVFSMQNARGVQTLFRRMLEKWRLQKPAVKEDTMSILYAIYAEILRVQSAAYIPTAKRKHLDLAVQYISENFADESLNVDRVAAVAGMSESHFRRIFKSAYHLSPVKYINSIRLNRAKEMIRYSGASFSEIASKTGFANLYYFSRIFKKEIGCTPSEYREAYSQYQET